MPQMAPLNWAPLMLTMTLALIALTAILFWNTMNLKQAETKKHPHNKISWKW